MAAGDGFDTPLYAAIQKQDVNIVEQLVKHLPDDKIDAASVELAQKLPDGTIKGRILRALKVDSPPPAYDAHDQK